MEVIWRFQTGKAPFRNCPLTYLRWRYARSVRGGESSRDKLTAFLISLFLGGLGADWFYLSLGNPVYIIAGQIHL